MKRNCNAVITQFNSLTPKFVIVLELNWIAF